MQHIKRFFTKHKVTLMVIPSAEKSIKQLKFNLGIAFIVLIGLILINISLLFNTLISKAEASHLTSENSELAVNLLITQDRIDSLYNISLNRAEEIEKLKESLASSAGFLEERLEEMANAEQYIVQLVTLFNEETNSNLPPPVSRSYQRQETPDVALMDTLIYLNDDDLLFEEIHALIDSDEISVLITEQAESYSSLVDELESRLSYLDRRPDFYPANGTLSSRFGFRRDPITGSRRMHNGIDISNRTGTSIYAAGSGIVTFARYSGSFGRVIIIDHGHGYETVYAHCQELLVSEGDSVDKGDLIAKMGSTGRATGSHLHFEIRYNGNPINPLNILKRD